MGILSTLGKGRRGPVGSVSTSGLHTCGPSGCVHVPQDRGPGLEASSAGVSSLTSAGSLSPGKSGPALGDVRVKLITGLRVGKLPLWSVPGEKGWDF